MEYCCESKERFDWLSEKEYAELGSVLDTVMRRKSAWKWVAQRYNESIGGKSITQS